MQGAATLSVSRNYYVWLLSVPAITMAALQLAAAAVARWHGSKAALCQFPLHSLLSLSLFLSISFACPSRDFKCTLRGFRLGLSRKFALNHNRWQISRSCVSWNATARQMSGHKSLQIVKLISFHLQRNCNSNNNGRERRRPERICSCAYTKSAAAAVSTHSVGNECSGSWQS